MPLSPGLKCAHPTDAQAATSFHTVHADTDWEDRMEDVKNQQGCYSEIYPWQSPDKDKIHS